MPKLVRQWLITAWNVLTALLEKQIYYMVADISMLLLIGYIIYYAATALLLSHHIEAATHNGVKTQLSMHFVRSGCLSLEHSTTLGLLFDKRHSSDYSDFAYCDALLVNMLRPRAEAFIVAVEALIKGND